MADLPLIQVECIETLDPPEISIIIAGQLPFQVSTGVYELLKGPLGLPDSPCAGIGRDD